MHETRRRRAFFLDRDGTINKQVGYCGDPAKIELLPDAAKAIRRINEMGLLAIVVTNQSAVARGLVTEDQVRRVNAEVALQVARAAGGKLDAFYYCPHHPLEGKAPYRRECDCRKPGGGMLKQAAAEFAIDLSRSFMVGDADIDHEAAKSAHERIITFELPSDYSMGRADYRAGSLFEAVERALGLASGFGA
ncbi:MAG: HAD family hydrolase [Planctomycetes bacterium]|nr:HAD family hydrolase [Planctomycetota bacterium]